MSLSIIVAMTEARVIGRDNKLPWHLPEDLKRFKVITMGHPIIMGRKTYESIGKPLPGRHNIVISRDPSRSYPGVSVMHNLEEALDAFGATDEELFVIGGAEIFKLALPVADKIYLTLIHHEIEGDTFFPEFNLQRDFKIISRTEHQSVGGEKRSYSFIEAERI